MTDLTSINLSRIAAGTMEGLPQDGDLTLPFYDGLSLTNLPHTMTHLLGVPGFGQPPLDDSILAELGGPYEKVVLLVVDALGAALLDRMLQQDPQLVWSAFRDRGVYSPITSVCPSTTASALTTLWTGVGPASHGIIGYEMWAKEFGMIINNILHAPASARSDVGRLSKSGFEPREFLGRPLLGTHLQAHGVMATAFMHSHIAHSGLSVMQMDDVNVKGYVNEADLWISLAEHLNTGAGVREYVYAYYGDVDTLMHRFGKDDDRVRLQFRMFSELFKKAFLDQVSETVAKDTLLVVSADHGSKITPRNPRYDLVNHPDLESCLVMQPTCENRLAFFYIKPGREGQLRDYFASTWPEEFVLLEPDVALENELFGNPPFKAQARERLGDLIAVAKGDAYLWWAPTPNHMAGRHGGLSREEMLVPFMAMPLSELKKGT
jgi:hypothetical protein